MSMFGEAYKYDDGVIDRMWRETKEWCKHGVLVSRDCKECYIELYARTGRWYGEGDGPDAEDL